MSSELHRFGIDDDDRGPDSRWKRGVNKLLRALLTNPDLLVGDSNSSIVHPPQVSSGSRGTATVAPLSSICYFGEVFVEEGSSYIRGGFVTAGDKHYDVPTYELTLGTPIDKLVQLKLDVEVWRDDDNEILMPGVKTSAETDASTFWDLKTWTLGTDYDDDTPPDVADGIGSIVIPLGHLVIADGAATFAPTGCGHVTIGHCGGTLSHSRG